MRRPMPASVSCSAPMRASSPAGRWSWPPAACRSRRSAQPTGVTALPSASVCASSSRARRWCRSPSPHSPGSRSPRCRVSRSRSACRCRAWPDPPRSSRTCCSRTAACRGRPCCRSPASGGRASRCRSTSRLAARSPRRCWLPARALACSSATRWPRSCPGGSPRPGSMTARPAARRPSGAWQSSATRRSPRWLRASTTGRCCPPAPRAGARPRSPPAASPPTSSIRARSRRAASRGCT